MKRSTRNTVKLSYRLQTDANNQQITAAYRFVKPHSLPCVTACDGILQLQDLGRLRLCQFTELEARTFCLFTCPRQRAWQ